MVGVIDIAAAVVHTIYTGINHLRDVEEEVGVFAKWESLGLNLGLYADRLEVIKQDAGLTEDRLRAVLRNWLRRNYNVEQNGLPSWKMLANAVQPIDGALAKSIWQRHS